MKTSLPFKFPALVIGILALPQTVKAAPEPVYSAINRLTVPTNAVVRREALPPPFVGGTPAQLPSPDYETNFQAITNGITDLAPPDTHGSVGPNHVVTMLNWHTRIQNRAGTTTYYTNSLTGFWTNAALIEKAFDPRVLYDPFHNRWIATAQDRGPQTGTNFVLIGVSMNDDPTGAWNRHKLHVNTNQFADHPVVGFNKDWIVVTINMFPGTGSNYSRIYVFNKTNLYASNAPTATLFVTNGLGICPVTSYDNTLTNLYLIQDYNGDTNAMGVLRLFKISGAVGSETLSVVTNFPGGLQTWTNAYRNPEQDNLAPQMGTTNRIHTLDSRIASAVYRNGSIWCTHTIFLPATNATRCAVQWWELSPNGAVRQRGVIDDPGGTNFYAFPSIGVNRFNDVLIGYSRFSSNQYASANYSFRAYFDPFNTLRTDRVLKAGDGAYLMNSEFANRWGDYSATVVDPVNDATYGPFRNTLLPRYPLRKIQVAAGALGGAR